jgi:hypothetical protein
LPFGEAGGVRTTRTPTVLSTASIAEVQFGSRSHGTLVEFFYYMIVVTTVV